MEAKINEWLDAIDGTIDKYKNGNPDTWFKSNCCKLCDLAIKLNSNNTNNNYYTHRCKYCIYGKISDYSPNCMETPTIPEFIDECTYEEIKPRIKFLEELKLHIKGDTLEEVQESVAAFCKTYKTETNED